MKQCTLRYAIVEVLVEIHQLLENVALRSIVIFVIVQGQMAFTSLNDPHVLGDNTVYVIMQLSSQRMGTMRYAVVLALPHLTVPPQYH